MLSWWLEVPHLNEKKLQFNWIRYLNVTILFELGSLTRFWDKGVTIIRSIKKQIYRVVGKILALKLYEGYHSAKSSTKQIFFDFFLRSMKKLKI